MLFISSSILWPANDWEPLGRCWSSPSYGISAVLPRYSTISFWYSKSRKVIPNRSFISCERELMKNAATLKMWGSTAQDLLCVLRVRFLAVVWFCYCGGRGEWEEGSPLSFLGECLILVILARCMWQCVPGPAVKYTCFFSHYTSLCWSHSHQLKVLLPEVNHMLSGSVGKIVI